MDELVCPFRSDIRHHAEGETAVCGFVQRLTGADQEHCRVDRSACELCAETSLLPPPGLNPVIPSAVLSAYDAATPVGPLDPVAGALRAWAAWAIGDENVIPLPPASFACDVVIVCESDGPDISSAIAAAHAQDDVFTVVHLVTEGPEASAVLKPYRSCAGVRLHGFHHRRGLWACVNDLILRLHTPFVAVPTIHPMEQPRLLHTALSEMDKKGAEIFASRATDGAPISPFVLRRSTIVDMGGFASNRADAGVELLQRAIAEERSIVHAPNTRRTLSGSDEPTPLASDQLFERATNTKPVARGSRGPFVESECMAVPVDELGSLSCGPAVCDVVLPFRDDLAFVRESLAGLLAQEEADVVIHLVDDDSRESTADLFDEHRGHPNVRLYRNSTNLGPFATFNNVSALAETPFIAVQDADDISLPRRIAHSCRLLELSGADLMAGRTELFGEPELVTEVSRCQTTDQDGTVRYFRESRYPDRRSSGYFLENPTLVMRVESFRRLGGYADFGESRRNRTGVDTEFQLRAYFARASIAVTNDVVVRYRCHGSSATNHADSGLGSAANTESHAEVRRRCQLYATGTFDPRWYGSLNHHAGVTVRVQ